LVENFVFTQFTDKYITFTIKNIKVRPKIVDFEFFKF